MATPAWGDLAVQRARDGKTIRQICNELGTEWGETWNHVRNAKGTEGVTWHSAKWRITNRLNQMVKQNDRGAREQLKNEISEYVDYIFTHARRMRNRVERARNTLNE